MIKIHIIRSKDETYQEAERCRLVPSARKTLWSLGALGNPGDQMMDESRTRPRQASVADLGMGWREEVRTYNVERHGNKRTGDRTARRFGSSEVRRSDISNVQDDCFSFVTWYEVVVPSWVGHAGWTLIGHGLDEDLPRFVRLSVQPPRMLRAVRVPNLAIESPV